MAKEAETEAAVLLSEEQAPTPTPAAWSRRQKVEAAFCLAALVALLVVLLFGQWARPTEDASVSLRGLQQLESCYCDCDWATKDSCPQAGSAGTIQNCCFKNCCDKVWAPVPDADQQHQGVEQQAVAQETPSDQHTLDTPGNHSTPLELNVSSSGEASGGASNLFWSFFR